jgi:hypothetical protein
VAVTSPYDLAGLPAGETPDADGDPFTLAEHRTRAVVAGPWWSGAAPAVRRQALATHLLMLPDHPWWMYGAPAPLSGRPAR